MRAQLAQTGGEIRWTGITRNISQGGIGVLFGRPFEPGSTLEMEIEGPAQESWVRMHGRVVHSTPQGPSQWLIGCQFELALPEKYLCLSWARNSELKPENSVFLGC